MVTGTALTLSLSEPTFAWQVGMRVSVDQSGGVTYPSGTYGVGPLAYEFTPITGQFKITAFTPYYPFVSINPAIPLPISGTTTSPAIPATPAIAAVNGNMTLQLPAGGTFGANAYNKKTTLDGMSDTSALLVGMEISGSGIAAGTFVIDIPDSQSVVLSQAVVLDSPSLAYGEYTFTPNYALPDDSFLFYTELGGRGFSYYPASSFTNVTSQFSMLSLSGSSTSNYAYAVSGGDISVVDSGESFSSLLISSVTSTASTTATASDSLTAFTGFASYVTTPIPPGQFVVLKSDDCCAQCLYVILYSPKTGGTDAGSTLFGGDGPTTLTGTISASQSSSYTVTESGSTSSSSTGSTVAATLAGYLTGEIVYTDKAPCCQYNGSMADAASFSPTISAFLSAISGTITHSASPGTPPPPQAITFANIPDYVAPLLGDNIYSVSYVMFTNTPAHVSTSQPEYLNSIDSTAEVPINPCALAGSYVMSLANSDPNYNYTRTVPASSSSITKPDGTISTTSATAKVTTLSLTSSSTITVTLS